MTYQTLSLDNKSLILQLQNHLSKKRFEHSLAVAKVAMQIAESNNLNKRKIFLAALLHDYCREMPINELLALAKKEKLEFSEIVREKPILLHGPVAAIIIANEFSITDNEILDAISFHTIPSGEMNNVAKTIYVADSISADREYQEADEIRKLPMANLNVMYAKVVEQTINFYLIKKYKIPEVLITNWNKYCEELN